MGTGFALRLGLDAPCGAMGTRILRIERIAIDFLWPVGYFFDFF